MNETAIAKFKERLDEEYLAFFNSDDLFKTGNKLYWENLNGVFLVSVIDFDGIKVRFKVDETGEEQAYSLDNLYIFNKSLLQSLIEKSKVYASETDSLDDYIHEDYACVYIIHDNDCDEDSGYYIGQALHGSWRIIDHNQESSTGYIDKLINLGLQYTLRFIPFDGSGYSNLDALETALIAYYDSFHKGYNKTRGNNGPGNKCITLKLLK